MRAFTWPIMRLQPLRVGLGVIILVGAALYAFAAGRERALDAVALRLPLRIVGDTSWVSLGPYEAFEPDELTDLSDSIRTRVESLLVAHLGAPYRRQLRFVGGQVVDHTHPVARNFAANVHWTVFGYRLGFQLDNPTDGVQSYIGYLTLDSAGQPIAPLEFPPVNARPDRARLVPLPVARDSARAHGIAAVAAALEFSAADSAFHYVLYARYVDHGMTGTQRFAVIDAHTGRFVRTGESNWIE